MSEPVWLSIRVEIEAGNVTLTAFNNGTEVARGAGVSVQEAVPVLVSYFKELQDATIDALYDSGLITRALDKALDKDMS